MFHQFDKVVYANYGACTITETDAHVSFGGGSEKTYYVLSPSSKRGGTVYVPVDHDGSYDTCHKPHRSPFAHREHRPHCNR